MINFNKDKYFQSLEKINKLDYKSYFNKKILITGANGLIGGSLLDFFMYLNEKKEANINIYVLVRSNLKKHTFFEYTKVNIITQSVTDSIVIDDSLDYIFHTASNAHPKAYSEFPVETMLTNLLGTMNILELAKIKKAKLINVSTSEVYGNIFDENKCMKSETDYGYIDILNSRACYPESKRASETLINSYIQEYDVQALTVRPAYIYGLRFNPNNTRADVEFIKSCLAKKDIVLKSKGLQKRSYCYVLDCVDAMLCVGLFGKNGCAYNISSDTGNMELVQFAQKLANYSGVKVVFNLSDIPGGSTINNSLLDNSRLKELGWNEIFGVDEGIKDIFKLVD